MPLELDGRLLPVEPGKTYILVYNEQEVRSDAIFSLGRWMEMHHITLLVLGCQDVHSIRLLAPESPEPLPVTTPAATTNP